MGVGKAGFEFGKSRFLCRKKPVFEVGKKPVLGSEKKTVLGSEKTSFGFEKKNGLGFEETGLAKTDFETEKKNGLGVGKAGFEFGKSRFWCRKKTVFEVGKKPVLGSEKPVLSSAIAGLGVG